MHLHFYLKPGGRARLERGEATMPARVIAAVQEVGWQVSIHPESERPKIPHRDGHHMVVNNEPEGPNCLVLRAAGFEPFWRIDLTNERWNWDTATLDYVPPDVPQERIDQFMAKWRGHVLKVEPSGGGGILVPLQGKLTERRSFQAASPITMLAEVLQHWPGRPVTATPHPSETYTQEETDALTALQAQHPNLRLAQGSTAMLAAADLVVAQNSTVAFKGFLLNKPAMLWARIDWHHIAASVPRDGRAAAFAAAESPQDFGRYLFWYLRRQCHCAWEDNPKGIRWRLRALGWPVAEPK